MAIGIRGFAAIIAVAALMVIGVACGTGAEPASPSDEVPTPALPTVGGKTPTTPSHGGPVEDYGSLVDNLRAAGATVDPAGTASGRTFAPQGSC
jgi:poly(3-hydroxybutyrate) depolymerase